MEYYILVCTRLQGVGRNMGSGEGVGRKWGKGGGGKGAKGGREGVGAERKT